MSIPEVTQKTTLFDGVPPTPKPIFTSIKPVIAHERQAQSAAIPVDKHYQVGPDDNRIIRLLQEIKKSKAKSVTIEKSTFLSSFTLEEINYFQTHCGVLGIPIEVVDDVDDDPVPEVPLDADLFVPKTPPIDSAPLFPETDSGEKEPFFPETYSGQEEPSAPSPEHYFSLQALDDYSSQRKPDMHSQTDSLASAPVLSQFFPDDDSSKSGLSPKIQALFEDESWFVEINDKEFTEAELEQIKEICAKKDIRLFHKTSL